MKGLEFNETVGAEQGVIVEAHSQGSINDLTTRLLASQTPDASGTVDGDVFLAGSGDPILETKALSAMVEEAIERGLKRVTGAVVGDTGAFDRSPYGWGWSWDIRRRTLSSTASLT